MGLFLLVSFLLVALRRPDLLIPSLAAARRERKREWEIQKDGLRRTTELAALAQTIREHEENLKARVLQERLDSNAWEWAYHFHERTVMAGAPHTFPPFRRRAVELGWVPPTVMNHGADGMVRDVHGMLLDWPDWVELEYCTTCAQVLHGSAEKRMKLCAPCQQEANMQRLKVKHGRDCFCVYCTGVECLGCNVAIPRKGNGWCAECDPSGKPKYAKGGVIPPKKVPAEKIPECDICVIEAGNGRCIYCHRDRTPKHY